MPWNLSGPISPRREGTRLDVCGIIAEFDPFHLGHLHLFEEARRLTGCDRVVCVLSSAFLQRGTPGLFSVRDRTRMALAAGADAVFALPVSFSCATADQFALGGVAVLQALGVVTSQAFGCENAGDLPLLCRAAECLNEEPGDFRDALRGRLQAGKSYPAAQAEALSVTRGIPAALLSAPNNVLAVAYLRQQKRLGADFRPVAVQRLGRRNAADAEGGNGYPPSSALRKALLDGDMDAVRAAVPAPCAGIIEECAGAGRLCPPEALTQALMYRLMTTSPDEWARYAPHGEGLELRLEKALQRHPATQAELLALLKTRRYTHAALQRWLSHMLLGLRPDEQPDSPGCLRLLGFREDARPLIRRIADRAALPLVTKPARGRAWLETDARAELLWGLGAGHVQSLYEQSPVITGGQPS